MKASRGLSLPELLVATLLFSTAATAAGSVAQFLARSQTDAARGEAADLAATYVSERLMSDLQNATHIFEPARGGQSSRLAFAKGLLYDPGEDAFIDAYTGAPAGTYSYLLYCLDGPTLWRYEELGLSIGEDPSPISGCPGDGGAGSWNVVAGNAVEVEGLLDGRLFSRPAAAPSAVVVGADFRSKKDHASRAALNLMLHSQLPEAGS